MLIKVQWRATSLINNLWTSAILAVLAGIVISVLVGLIIDTKLEVLLVGEYLWHVLVVLFLCFFITRLPKNTDKVVERG